MALNLPSPNRYALVGTQQKMGAVRFATAAEAAAGTAVNVALSPATGAGSVPSATTTVEGKVFLATNAEAVTGTNATKAVVPAALTARLAAPGAIGGTTPAAGSFTTLDASSTITAQADVVLNGAATKISMQGGAVTDFIGQATLTAGTVTVLNTNIAAGDKVLVSRQGINGSTALGVFDVVITPATSFSITARNPADATTQVNDVSIVDYVIVRMI